MEFIEHSLEQIIQGSKGEIQRYKGDLTNAYFIGASLCLDTRDEFENESVIVLHYEDEVFFEFGEGFKQLLSIKAIRLMDQLMESCKINREKKFWI